MDRISGLPEPIQHDILNFLEEKEIGRAAVLSRAWRSIVQTRPALVFDQRLFKSKRGSDKLTTIESEDLLFMNHVDKSVQQLVGQDDRSIQKFSLVAYLHDTKSWSHNLDRWIQQLVQAKLKVLSLHLRDVYVLPPFGFTYGYVFPPFVFLSETITNLRLDHCDLGQCNYMRLPNLLELSLEHVTLSQDMIDQISSGCPNLKILRLKSCRGFSSICVSGLVRLYKVEFSLSGRLDVKVVAPMLGVFKICSWRCNSKMDLLACESTLRNLTLSRVSNITAEGLTSPVSKFLGLEELVLNHLFVKSIEIPNQKLLQLEVSNCSRLERSVRIDAPNLRVLKYCENNLPFDPVISSISPNCVIEFYAKLVNNLTEFKSYKDLVLKLSGLANMKLILSDHNRSMIVCQVLDENVIKMIDDAKTLMIQSVEMVCVTTHEQMADRLFDSCVSGFRREPNTFSILSRDQQSNEIFLEALRKESWKEKKEEANCCRYKSPKCWKCRLYDAEVINEETIPWPLSNLLHKSIIAMGYKIARIKLHWIWM